MVNTWFPDFFPIDFKHKFSGGKPRFKLLNSHVFETHPPQWDYIYTYRIIQIYELILHRVAARSRTHHHLRVIHPQKSVFWECLQKSMGDWQSDSKHNSGLELMTYQWVFTNPGWLGDQLRSSDQGDEVYLPCRSGDFICLVKATVLDPGVGCHCCHLPWHHAVMPKNVRKGWKKWRKLETSIDW
jgi:hypothetical protein